MGEVMSLAVPKGKKVQRPNREPDHHSKRGIPYWWAPDWCRDTNGTVGRLMPIREGKEDENVYLYSVSKAGNPTYIQGSIQREFKDWHADNLIDCILLGMDLDELEVTDWSYED